MVRKQANRRKCKRIVRKWLLFRQPLAFTAKGVQTEHTNTCRKQFVPIYNKERNEKYGFDYGS